jgi:hypothetical protein
LLRGNFIMVNLGERIDIKTDEAEVAISEKLIAGGVFLVSCLLLVLATAEAIGY